MEKPKNAVEALIGILRSPIAQRRGWGFDAYDCAAWADELEMFLKSQDQQRISNTKNTTE